MKTSALAALAGLACSVMADDIRQYSPQVNYHLDRSDMTHLAPKLIVSTLYASNLTTDNSTINITLQMNHPTVLLENVEHVSKVVCEEASVEVTFNDTLAFGVTLTEWKNDGEFVLITNHLGDCDSAAERGFYLIGGLTWNNDTLTVSANSVKTNITDSAGMAQVDFDAIPASTVQNKVETISARGLSSRNNAASGSLTAPKTCSLDLCFAKDEVLYSTDHFKLVADEVSFDTNVTYSGRLKYDIFKHETNELWFDIELSQNLTIDMTAVITSTLLNRTSTYAPGTLTASIIHVPGILTIGPGIGFSAQAELSVSSPVNISLKSKVGLYDGRVRLDFVNLQRSIITGWKPSYDIKTEMKAKVNATFSPSSTLDVKMVVNFLHGLVDLSSGIKASPGFHSEFVVSADQVVESVDGKVKTVQANNMGNCNNGVEVYTSFTFSLVGYVTRFLSASLYGVEVPISQECWTWA